MNTGNELDLCFPHSEYNGEDCIIIPISQITNIEITMTCSVDDTGPEMILTVRGNSNDYRYSGAY